jgi:hypothetical protein
MHPIIAYRTLQNFGFKAKTTYDAVAGQQLIKVQSVADWLKNLKENNPTGVDVDKIANENEKIMHYLKHVVAFVNANPSILNKNYSGATTESAGKTQVTDYAKALGIAARIEPKGTAESSYSMRIFGKNFKLYADQGPVNPFSSARGHPYSTPFGLSITPDLPMVGMQAGGGIGSATDFLLRRYTGQTRQQAVGGELIQGIITSLLNELGNRGKTLSAKDKENIKKRVDQLIKSEVEMLRLVAYIEEYNKLLDATKDYSTATISENDLRRYVEKHGSLGQRQVKQEQYLLDVVNKIQKQLSEETGGSDLSDLPPAF